MLGVALEMFAFVQFVLSFDEVHLAPVGTLEHRLGIVDGHLVLLDQA